MKSQIPEPASARYGPGAKSGVISRASNAAVASFLVLCGTVPYVNTLFNGFVYDDNTQVMNNPYIQSFRYLREIFSTTVWSYIGVLRGTNYYRPMMTFGYLLAYQFFGPLAYGFHLTNILLHTAVVCVLFLVAEHMFQDRFVAVVAAILFALHPIHTESVAWIAAVTDLELTLFSLLTFWFFLRVARRGGGRSDGAQIGLVVSFVLALLSKEQALTIPLLATAYEHICRDDRAETTLAQKFLRYHLLWLLSIAYFAFRVRFFGAFAPILQRPDLTWYQTLLTAVELAGQYVRKLLWLVQLCAFYVFHKRSSLLDPHVVAGMATLLLYLAALLALWRRSRLAFFGLIWVPVTLAPVLNARWLPANVFTERYLYLPSVGFCWAAAEGIARLWGLAASRGTVWRKALAIGLGSLAALCFLRIVVRNRDWHDDIVLYNRTLELQPDAWHIRNNLAGAYWLRGNAAAAEREWNEALRLKAENQIVLSNLGLAYSKQKKYPEAIKYFQRALEFDPRLTDGHLHLGEVYLELGQAERAEFQFRAAVALSPLDTRARNRLGQVYLDKARLGEAEEQFLRSVESEANATGYDGLGDVELARSPQGKAERYFARAIAVDPFDSHAHFKLGEVYAKSGRNAEAVREYQAGLMTDPNNAEALAALKKLTPEVRDAKSPKS